MHQDARGRTPICVNSLGWRIGNSIVADLRELFPQPANVCALFSGHPRPPPSRWGPG